MEQWTVMSQSEREKKKIIVVSACLSRVVTAERWLLRLFVVSAALREREEEPGYRRVGEKDKKKKKMIGTYCLKKKD